jgi:hypothetical protein
VEAQVNWRSNNAGLVKTLCLSTGLLVLWVVPPEPATAQESLDVLLERTAKQAASFLDLISETNCTERVLQEKLADNGKVVEKEESTFDYLIILSTSDGELNLVESRIAPEDAKTHKKLHAPLLISNGFSSLFLIFHPYYASGFLVPPGRLWPHQTAQYATP